MANSSKKISYLYFVPAGLWALLILLVCLMAPKYLPNFKFELLSPDKIVHAGLFGLLCLLLLWALIKNDLFTHKNMLIFAGCCIVYGAFIEFLQMIGRNGRHADIDDIVANAIGVVLAYLFYITFYRSLIKNSHPN